MKTTTKSGKQVTLRVRSVGTNFGVVGQVVARNGRVLGEGDTRPVGCASAAMCDAAALAAKI